MDSLEKMNGALQYIEDYLTDEIDMKEVAKIACCSDYHFKRTFSFLAGISLSDYIRRRRLSLAALDLMESDTKVIDIAIKYGYSSPDSFTRAFQSLHGVTPSEARAHKHSLKAYPRMTFQLTIQGGTEMNYKIEKKDAFHIVGVKRRVSVSDEGVNPGIAQFLEEVTDELTTQLEGLSNIDPSGILHVNTNYVEDKTEEGELDYYYAVATTKSCPDNLSQLGIPASTWAIFEVDGEWSDIQDVWGRVYSEWFPASNYELSDRPEILSSTHEKTEIWIPVKKK
ncbi:AraC family transcriptional regulator [Evansella halocellulosilytica]|uniref:AraC family transcriptional regulator n=1 Tax=Evansella halocellulosilytica TaxID=2011013 RepID=UPI000BB6DF1D|nr:AraC family transcriptional regulator [Evansella halocellulosilytica]